jgi:hydrogenase maturation protease
MSGGRILVVGVGNPDRGDDGAGLLAAGLLRGRLPAGVALLDCRGDPLGLLDLWEGCAAAVLIDAAAGAQPGRLHRFDAQATSLPANLSPTSSHAFGLAETIALGRVLGRLPAHLVVHAIEASSFGHGAPLSPAVAAAASVAAGRVAAEVAALCQQTETETPCTNPA